MARHYNVESRGQSEGIWGLEVPDQIARDADRHTFLGIRSGTDAHGMSWHSGELLYKSLKVPKDHEQYWSFSKPSIYLPRFQIKLIQACSLIVGSRLRRLNKTRARYFTLSTCNRIHCLAQAESKYLRNRRTSSWCRCSRPWQRGQLATPHFGPTFHFR